MTEAERHPAPTCGLCIHDILRRHARQTPDATAIMAPDRPPLTYARLLAHVEEVVADLNSMGLGRRDRVAFALPRGPEPATAFLAVACGAACVPLNPASRPSEFESYLTRSRATALITCPAAGPTAAEAARSLDLPVIGLEPSGQGLAGLFTLSGKARKPAPEGGFAGPDDLALLLRTSGTTSRPKKVPLTHRNICAGAHNICRGLELRASDRNLCVTPLFHINGLVSVLLSSLAAGGSVTYPGDFDASKFFGWLATCAATWYIAMRPIHEAILEYAPPPAEVKRTCNLRFVGTGAAFMPLDLADRLEVTFGVPVMECYGMTEAASRITNSPMPPRARKRGSVGVSAGLDVAAMDEAGSMLPPGREGEVAIRGLSVMEAYEDDPEANARAFVDGWFRTGDLGRLDSDGYLFLGGRIKEIINRGGEKVSPFEVEEALLAHPAVAQAVAFAIPDDRLGEDVGAAVVLQTGTTAGERELRDFASERLAYFKVPRRVIFTEKIPSTSTGKLQRVGLAERLGLIAADGEGAAPRPTHVAPRNSAEQKIADIWAEVLELERVGVRDHFLDIGGDSIQAFRVVVRICQAFDVKMPMHRLFEAPTVAELARMIEASGGRPITEGKC